MYTPPIEIVMKCTVDLGDGCQQYTVFQIHMMGLVAIPLAQVVQTGHDGDLIYVIEEI